MWSSDLTVVGNLFYRDILFFKTDFSRENLFNEADKAYMKKSSLTILQCLYDFRVARHALNRPIKWRNEKFILGELAQTANIKHLELRLRYDDSAVLLRSTMQLTISDKKTL